MVHKLALADFYPLCSQPIKISGDTREKRVQKISKITGAFFSASSIQFDH
jgi:hypothetical protein